jgi:hypothetical protein
MLISLPAHPHAAYISLTVQYFWSKPDDGHFQPKHVVFCSGLRIRHLFWFSCVWLLSRITKLHTQWGWHTLKLHIPISGGKQCLPFFWTQYQYKQHEPNPSPLLAVLCYFKQRHAAQVIVQAIYFELYELGGKCSSFSDPVHWRLVHLYSDCNIGNNDVSSAICDPLHWKDWISGINIQTYMIIFGACISKC